MSWTRACATPDAEALYSARGAESEQVHATAASATSTCLPTTSAGQGAQRALARTGQRRAVAIADLFTAVLAAEHATTIVHYAADFEIAAEVLESDRRRLVPRGSV